MYFLSRLTAVIYKVNFHMYMYVFYTAKNISMHREKNPAYSKLLPLIVRQSFIT